MDYPRGLKSGLCAVLRGQFSISVQLWSLAMLRITRDVRCVTGMSSGCGTTDLFVIDIAGEAFDMVSAIRAFRVALEFHFRELPMQRIVI